MNKEAVKRGKMGGEGKEKRGKEERKDAASLEDVWAS